MKCTNCDSTMAKSVGDHAYVEGGLPNVVLRGITKYACPNCGAKRISIFAVERLHRTIAIALAQKPARLLPHEVKFLRDHLELANKDFAEMLGVSSEQASRWVSPSNPDPIGVPAERFLRVLAILGPEALQKREASSDEIEAVQIGSADLVRTIGHLPPPSTPAREIEIGLRRAGSTGWKQEAVVP